LLARWEYEEWITRIQVLSKEKPNEELTVFLLWNTFHEDQTLVNAHTFSKIVVEKFKGGQTILRIFDWKQNQIDLAKSKGSKNTILTFLTEVSESDILFKNEKNSEIVNSSENKDPRISVSKKRSVSNEKKHHR